MSQIHSIYQFSRSRLYKKTATVAEPPWLLAAGFSLLARLTAPATSTRVEQIYCSFICGRIPDSFNV
jgi:hypothetical protein